MYDIRVKLPMVFFGSKSLAVTEIGIPMIIIAGIRYIIIKNEPPIATDISPSPPVNL